MIAREGFGAAAAEREGLHAVAPPQCSVPSRRAVGIQIYAGRSISCSKNLRGTSGYNAKDIGPNHNRKKSSQTELVQPE